MQKGGGANIFCSWSGCLLEMSENLSPTVHSFNLCGKINRQKNKQTNKPLSFHCVHKPGGGGANIFCSWSGRLLEMSENESPIVYSFHLCEKINRQTNRQTNKPLSFDCVHKPEGLIIFARGADIV